MIHKNLVKIGMADLNVLKGSGVLKTSGLGSCVGLTLYDARTKVAGMAHIMLPSSEIAREHPFNVAKYADTAIIELLDRMLQAGAIKSNLVAKMAGGSQMFAFSSSSQNDIMRIGPRNVESCKAILQSHSIPIVAEDTGGNYGRTIEFHCDTGMLHVYSVRQGVKVL